MKILGLDLATRITGWVIFEKTSNKSKLVDYGVVKKSVKGLPKDPKLHAKVVALKIMAQKVTDIAERLEPHYIVIEEITSGKNRLGQKVLDAFHFFVLDNLQEYLIQDRVYLKDVSGATGWRFELKIKLSDHDKFLNKEARATNKDLLKSQKKLVIIGYKHLSVRFANKKFGLSLDYDKNKTDGDIADAICMTYAFIKKNMQSL